MLRFKVHHLQLGKRHYVLLPKLNSLQIDVLAKRFAEMGVVRRDVFLAVTSKEGTIRVSEMGLCWSSFDPSDAVLPAVPALLSCPREEAPLETIRRMYLIVSKSRDRLTAKITPRLETSTLWRGLRRSGECALAPDEHAIGSFILQRVRGKCEMVTDFFVDGSTPLVFGRRRYFNSKLGPDEAALALRKVGERHQRSSYVPQDGELGPVPVSSISQRDWIDLVAELGEWCPFTPV